MCKYCDITGDVIYCDWKDTENGAKGMSICIYEDKLGIDVSTSGYKLDFLDTEIDINYCPMCGKKLKPIDK